MEHRPAGDNLLHPRLTVAWMSDGERAALRRALPLEVAVVTAGALDGRMDEVSARRREQAEQSVSGLEDDVERLRAERDAAAQALAGLLSRRSELHDAALWCEAAPDTGRRLQEREQALQEEIEEQGRVARTAGRQLERVLEQRAAAEQALVDARRQLDDLGAVGVDETGVRRQLEQSSSELRLASADYRAAMTELARRRAHLEELEAVSDGTVTEVRVDDSQLDLMRAALDAKYSRSAPTSGAGAIDAARDAVAEAEADADRAAERLAAARDRIASFEQELARRTEAGATADARRQAAAALEAQVLSVEQRLAEAEATARDEAEEATLALARAEHELERVRQEVRDHRRQLQTHVAGAREAPPASLDHGADELAAWLAAALRTEVAAMEHDVAAARQALHRADSELGAANDELEALRADGPGGIAPVDRRTAVATFIDDATVALVLDDVVGADRALAIEDLLQLDDAVPVVLLTTDPDVVSWAIELDASAGAVASAHAVSTALAAEDRPDRDTTAEPPIRTTLECSP